MTRTKNIVTNLLAAIGIILFSYQRGYHEIFVSNDFDEYTKQSKPSDMAKRTIFYKQKCHELKKNNKDFLKTTNKKLKFHSF